MAKITPDGKTYYYGTDNLGSTTVLFDEDGDVVWKGEISAFGDVVLGEWIGEELFNERVRFTGKDFDEVTGLYYFNARWYDPLLGRFTSEDPARDGMNWYVYVRNNPLNRTDPTGLTDRGLTQNEIDYMTEIIGDSWRGQHQIDYSAIKVYDRGATTQKLHNINQQENVGIPAAVINAQSVEPNRPKGVPGGNVFLPPGTKEEVKLHEVVHTQHYIEHGNQQALATLMTEQANYDQYQAGGWTDESLNPYNYQHPANSTGNIQTLDDIITLEGQAQYIEDFAKDYNIYKSSGVYPPRVTSKASVLQNSGFSSTAITAVLTPGL